ncbi:MAG: AMP-binding protein [Simkaniaceae bacterium]|nr:AMP-binding protein [Candidatus Sacchlamyda saccharinae]
MTILMNPCPLAHWKKHRPDALALSSLTYRELDTLIQKICYALPTQPILAFAAQPTPFYIALFFAAWRLGKAVYPLNPRLPKRGLKERIQKTGATWIDPEELVLTKTLEISNIDENKLATFIETSSASKIACHVLKSHLTSATSAIQILNIRQDSKVCLNLPLFHVSGIASMLRALIAGAQIVFSEDATHISMVPTQLYRLLKENKTLPICQSLLMGGAPLPEKIYKLALEKKLPLLRSYGMTETASMIICENTVLPHAEIKFAQGGELMVKGPSLLSHYFGGNKIEDWFATRDLGKINKQGQIEITGRKDRQFISGGENIQPEEIEKALLTLDSVIGARITSIEDAEFGRKIQATLYTEKTLIEENLKSQLKELIAPHKIPKDWSIIIDEAPSKLPLESAWKTRS